MSDETGMILILIGLVHIGFEVWTQVEKDRLNRERLQRESKERLLNRIHLCSWCGKKYKRRNGVSDSYCSNRCKSHM